MEKLKLNNVQFSRNVEVVILVLAFSALYFALGFLAPGGPISTDVTWYMNAGMNGIKDTFILNRYFHVFLQTVFLDIASKPLIGLQNYWAFLITGISLLIYLAARNLTSNNRPLHAVLAVALFFSTGIVADTAGLPLVDITVMFMVLSFIVVYIASTRKLHKSKILIALLGFLFFLAFKTKETTLPIGILLLGLFIDNDNGIEWKVYLRRLGYFFVGVFTAIVFFAILSWFFLGDPLFGMRPYEFSKFMATYIPATLQQDKYSGKGNWFTSHMLNDLWIPFTLYLISGARSVIAPSINRGIRLIWLLPLLMVILVIMSVGNLYGYMQRFVFPAIPVVCILAPQFLNLDLRSVHDRRRRNTAIVIFIVGLLTMVAFRIIMKQIFLSKGWDVAIVMTAVFIPILFSVILALVFLWKRTPLFVSYLVSVLIIAITIISISHNVKQITIAQPNRKFSDKLFYPFSVFTGHINFSSDMEFYISPDVWREMETSYFLKDRLEISSLFNVFFDAGSTKYNFIIPEESSDIPGDLIKSDFTHVLLSTGDWQTISAMPEIRDQLENKYLFYSDDKNVLIFLKPKP
jgi:hypothetical protein